MSLFPNAESARQNESLFNSIKLVNEYGQEYWTARELFKILGYKQWRVFKKVIDKAVLSCKGSENNVNDHFVRTRKMVNIGSGSKREIEDYNLSRYACYLIAMNGNPSVEEIALAQTYFAVKTRQQELIEHYDELSDDNKRLAIRQEMKKHHKSLTDAAHDASIIQSKNYAIFQLPAGFLMWLVLCRKKHKNDVSESETSKKVNINGLDSCHEPAPPAGKNNVPTLPFDNSRPANLTDEDNHHSSFFIYCTYTKDCGAQEMPYSPRLLGLLNFFTLDSLYAKALSFPA